MKKLLTLLFCFALAGGVYAANDFYVHGGFPAIGSTGSSAGMRAELDSITAGFDKLPALTGNANKAVVVNSGGTGTTVTAGTMALTGNFSIAGNFSTTGAFNTSFTQGATTTLILPLVNGTLATLAGTETLTTKTFNLTSNTLTGTTAQFNTALSDNDFATLAGSETLTTKTINLTSNTVSGTTAQFNTALSDNDFATLTGAEALQNKTMNLTFNALGGTTAQFNTALSDNDFATLAGSEVLTNKTLTSGVLNTQVSGTAIAAQSDVDAGTSAVKILVPSLNLVSLGSPTASTSGTTIDYTSLPANTRVIRIMFSGVSTNGTSIPMIQLGDSGGIENSGYLGGACYGQGTASCDNHSTGFIIGAASAAFSVRHGTAVLTLLDSSTNTWSFSSSISNSDTNSNPVAIASGAKSTSAVLDRIRITTVNGTDTFDAGKVNIQYER